MSQFKILCIDDSKSVHAFLKECVKEICSDFGSALNGEEGIKKATEMTYDIIFLDWEMPVKNGPDTYHELREKGVATPIFMLTSKNDPKDIMQMLDAGVIDYIMKPFTKDIIVEKIQQNIT